MTKKLPALFSYSIESLKLKIEIFLGYNFTMEEIISMGNKYPGIFSGDPEKLKKKLEYLKEINLIRCLIEKPKNLMQSVELTYARYKFYESNGIIITMDNYGRLFDSEKTFEKRSHYTKEELMRIYKYEEFLGEERV